MLCSIQDLKMGTQNHIQVWWLNLHNYGHEVEIVKKECVGHVQKRYGTALQKLKPSVEQTRLKTIQHSV